MKERSGRGKEKHIGHQEKSTWYQGEEYERARRRGTKHLERVTRHLGEEKKKEPSHPALVR